MITRREQLTIRARGKKDKDGEPKKGKGKGAGKGKGKSGKGKSGKGKSGNGKSGKGKSGKGKGTVKPQKEESHAEKKEDKVDGEKKTRARRAKKANIPDDVVAEDHDIPATQPRKKQRRSMSSKPRDSPASPAELPTEAVEPVKPEPKRRGRMVATPQVQAEVPPPMATDLTVEQMKDSFKSELSHQWKSSKTNLGSDDFPSVCFASSTLSCYFSRSRPAIGVKARGTAKKGVNKEYAYFSFNLKEVCNVGLAMRCATTCVP